ncbi:MAG: transcription/translation regulatory transformer protein RfaH [Burkholderiaceae bacterium]|nr:transcription/translation regulatory transformer protein RfaH [Burkholderiaceae bacterium]
MTPPRWHLVYTKPREERRALEHLRRQDYECYLPERPVERMRDGHRCIVTEPLFPRYLFIRLAPGTSNWLPIRSTRGVSTIVRFGNRFPALPDEDIEALRQGEVAVRPLFETGARLVAVEGPFAGVQTLYLEPDGDTRVRVLLEILGSEQRVSLPLAGLRAVGASG